MRTWTQCFATFKLYGSSVDRSTKTVKKHKLTGVLKEYGFYYKDQDMFSGTLEVAEFEGANFRTVSGISGQTRNALSKPDGSIQSYVTVWS